MFRCCVAARPRYRTYESDENVGAGYYVMGSILAHVRVLTTLYLYIYFTVYIMLREMVFTPGFEFPSDVTNRDLPCLRIRHKQLHLEMQHSTIDF